MKTDLYRYFAEDQTLLYVGISKSAWDRHRQHQQNAEWYDQQVTMTRVPYPTRKDALDAEKEAIKSEKPLFNIQHNPDRKSKMASVSIKPSNGKFAFFDDGSYSNIKAPWNSDMRVPVEGGKLLDAIIENMDASYSARKDNKKLSEFIDKRKDYQRALVEMFAKRFRLGIPHHLVDWDMTVTGNADWFPFRGIVDNTQLKIDHTYSFYHLEPLGNGFFIPIETAMVSMPYYLSARHDDIEKARNIGKEDGISITVAPEWSWHYPRNWRVNTECYTTLYLLTRIGSLSSLLKSKKMVALRRYIETYELFNQLEKSHPVSRFSYDVTWNPNEQNMRRFSLA